MRKAFFFFLCGLVFIVTSTQLNATDVLTNNIFISEIKKPVLKPQIAFSGSLKDTAKKEVYHKKHRLVAALLAFPLGVFGLHRMYLHTSAKVPIIYIVTLGGGLGILPFIDFVLILLNKDIHTNYTSNLHLFMWEKRERIIDTLQHSK